MKSCKYFFETNDGNLCFCKHKENKEGNCGKDICPLGQDTFDILKENEELKEMQVKIKQMVLRVLKNV